MKIIIGFSIKNFAIPDLSGFDEIYAIPVIISHILECINLVRGIRSYRPALNNPFAGIAANSQKITDVLRRLRTEGKTVIVSTHEKQLLAIADQKLCLQEGRLAIYHD